MAFSSSRYAELSEALDLAGTANQGVTVNPSLLNTTFNGSFTLSLWLLADALPPPSYGEPPPITEFYFLGKGGTSFTDSLWGRRTGSDGHVEFGMCDAGGHSVLIAYPSTQKNGASDGAWHHYAVVCDRAAGRMKAFLDGKLVNVVALPANFAINNTDPLIIGNSSLVDDPTSESGWGGAIDDFVLTESALAPLDIAALVFNASYPPTEPQFVGPLVSSVSQGTVAINWQGSTDPDQTANKLQYQLQYSLSGANGSWQPLYRQDSGSDTSAVATFLPPINAAELISGESYNWDVSNFVDYNNVYLRVRAYDGCNYSEWETVGPFGIDDGPPRDPSIWLYDNNYNTLNYTYDRTINVSLDASGASQVLLSEFADFSDKAESDWQSLNSVNSYLLSNGYGQKTVYAKFRDTFGTETGAVSSAVTYLAPATVTITANTTLSAADIGVNDDVLIDGATLTLVGDASMKSLRVIHYGKLTQPRTTETEEHRLNITVSDFIEIGQGSEIDVQGCGYLRGHTFGNVVYTSTDVYAGGSHGGFGASLGGNVPALYGNFLRPTTLGSGAIAASTNDGASGGGAVHIVANRMILNGRLRADGVADLWRDSWISGGAGGSILLDLNSLEGTGSITADGGMPYSNACGGGGGRIAVYCNELKDTFNPHANITANGIASGFYDDQGNRHDFISGAGTIYFKVASRPYGELIVANRNNYGAQTSAPSAVWFGNRYDAQGHEDFSDDPNPISLSLTSNAWTRYVLEIAPTTSFANLKLEGVKWTKGNFNVSGDLTLADSATLTADAVTAGGNLNLDTYARLTTDDVTVAGALALTNGAVLESAATTLTAEHGLVVQAGSVSVDSSSRIDVSAKGYPYGITQGLRPYSAATAGGSHGGVGASSDGAICAAYGDFRLPNALGSGGGNPTAGGAGGGSILLTATSLALDGSILANGESYGASARGSGAGGSIWLDVNNISGAGMISANGGQGPDASSGGGGGGRVAVYYQSLALGPNSIFAMGGPSYDGSLYNGGAGTIYLENKQSDLLGQGSLIIDGQGVSGMYKTPVRGIGEGVVSAIDGVRLIDSLANFPISDPASGVAGLEDLWVQPNTVVNQYFKVTGNDATSLTIADDGTFADIAQAGNNYKGVVLLGSVTVKGTASVFSKDQLILTQSALSVENNSLWVQEGTLNAYPFSGDANDTVGTANGSVVGATLTTDRIGREISAYHFDGSSHIDLGMTDLAAAGLQGNIYISAWVKRTASTSGRATILAKATGNGNETFWFGFSSDGRLGAATTNAAGETIGDYSDSVVRSNAWVHVGFFYDKSARQVTLYINDSAVKSWSTGSDGELISTTADSIVVGAVRDNGTDTDLFEGDIDDVVVANRVVGEKNPPPPPAA